MRAYPQSIGEDAPQRAGLFAGLDELETLWRVERRFEPLHRLLEVVQQAGLLLLRMCS